MNILILGGTGAMGTPLVKLLSESNNDVFVTTRSKKENFKNIHYLCGNAKDNEFFDSLMKNKYDVIIDFMVYQTEELKKRLSVILENTNQYFFFSSSRCYAESASPIKETSARLVDVCKDEEYLSLDEYGMAKGREENILFESGSKNWTIIRPYITFNDYRLQLGVYEKENWLRRALNGKTIVLPKDIAEKKTSLTLGNDVAKAIYSLIGNEKAFGEAFHITTSESHTWKEILDFYCEKIEMFTGKKPKVKLVENSLGLQKVWNKWQIKYDRLYNRVFDNSKFNSVVDNFSFTPTFDGLEKSLKAFINKPEWLGMNWKYEAWCDRQAGEFTSLKKITGQKNKLRYLYYRFLKSL